MRTIDVRKPLHAVLIGVIVAGILAPVLGYWFEEARYSLASDQVKVMAHASKQLADRLAYDSKDDAVYFNKNGKAPAGEDGMMKLGSAGSKDVYSAKMPTKAAAGIALTDTQHKTAVTMSPQFATLDGRKGGSRVLYPLKDQPGVLALTPKGNGVKEDIVLNGAPSDRVQYDYKLKLDAGLEARVQSNGAVGVYSGDPALFGNISYSSDADKASVDNARKNADKTYLMFGIPAPEVKQADGKAHGVKAHFVLGGDTLSVVVTGMAKASYPLSIDPSFVITTQSDFLLGKIEDNITLNITSGTDAELRRAKITAGLVGTWGTAVAGNLPTTGGAGNAGCAEAGGVNFNFGMTAYNGYLYLVGGGNGAGRFVCYAALNSNGTLGTWTPTTTTFATGRIGSTVVGFNGYIYVMNGEDSSGNTQYKNVDFAPVTSTGDITATWTSSTSYYTGTNHTFGGGVTYNGFIYMCGGATVKKDASLIATCEYTQINSDGTLQRPTTSCTLSGTATNWCTTTSFTTARNRFGMAVYNGYIYIVGGYNGTSVLSDVQYVSIAPDYSLGTWATTTAVTGVLASGWRNGGIAAEQGHLYLVGGCTTSPACSGALNGTYYAVINADGTIGPWDTSSTFTTARFFNGVASYNGVLYTVAGCTVEPTNANNCSTALGDSQYVQINTTPGDTTGSFSGNSISAARSGIATLAYNGWLYAAGGCNGTSCGTYVSTVDAAKVNDDGSLGTWTTTGMGPLPTPTGMAAGRTYGTLVGVAGKLYYIGGLEKTSPGGVDHYANNVLVAAQTASTGVLSWSVNTNATDTFATNGRAYHAAAQWGNYIYVLGGYDGTSYLNDVRYTQIVNGTLTDPNACGSGGNVWCSTSSFGSTGTAGLGAGAYAGYMYVAGGRDSANAAITAVYSATISNSTGAVGSFSTSGNTALPSGPHRYIGMVIHNNVIYALGGMTDASGNAPSNVISCAALNGSTGAVGAWTTCSRTLTTARWATAAAVYDGRLYVVGGCTSTGVPPCTTYSASAEYLLIRNGGTGLFGTTTANTNPWASTGSALVARSDAQMVAYNSNLYVIGGCKTYNGSGVCTSFATDVQHAAISASGSLGAFTSSTVSPPDVQLTSGQARMLGAAIAYVGRVYLLGGTSSTQADTDDVISAPFDGLGNVSAWTVGTSMPEVRHGFSATISGGRVYVVGGKNGSNWRNTVMYSEIGENGTLINWLTDNTHTFATGREGLTTLAYNSNLYVIAGADSSGNALGDIQFSPIGTDGSLGNWVYTNRQDQLGKFRQAAAANGYMYFFGSENSGNDVFFAAINSNGTIGNLYRASNSGMSSTHPHGGVVYSDGFFYAVGGCTPSGISCTTATPSTTSEYAGQKAQARIGHYSKMFNTEVNTAPSFVQANGSGQFIITMRTAAVGTTTWGVPQYISPAYATKFYFLKALDGTGTNVGIAFNYYLFLIIDDSNTGAFPDTGSVASDVDIYYHPNPTRRLRHGASFTNTGCNRDITQGCLLDTAQ